MTCRRAARATRCGHASCSSWSPRCTGTGSPPPTCARPARRSSGCRPSRGSRCTFRWPRTSCPRSERLLTDIVAAGLSHPHASTSRTSPTPSSTAAALERGPTTTFRPRIGTGLWLGDRGALDVRATVLDAHPVDRGERFGYRQRSAPRAGTLLVVSGGTAHGIGLEAPTGASSFRARAGSLARGGLDAAGLVRSPYTVDGKQRCFAEPPHMQASMLFLPSGATVPDVGDEVPVRVRYTATDVRPASSSADRAGRACGCCAPGRAAGRGCRAPPSPSGRSRRPPGSGSPTGTPDPSRRTCRTR